MQGEAASARIFTKKLFKMDESGLLWKKMPTRTFILQVEKSIPGFKPAKDHLMFLLESNVEGDLKLKPLLVCRPENPRALKNYARGLYNKLLFFNYFTNPRPVLSGVPPSERAMVNVLA